MLQMIKFDIKRPEFVKESREYGIDLIKNAVQTQDVKQASKELVVETFVRDERVKQKGKNICKYFVSHPESKSLSAAWLKSVVLKDEVNNAIVIPQMTLAS